MRRKRMSCDYLFYGDGNKRKRRAVGQEILLEDMAGTGEPLGMKADYDLPPDVCKALPCVRQRGKSPLCRGITFGILKYAALAKRNALSLCQDTGSEILCAGNRTWDANSYLAAKNPPAKQAEGFFSLIWRYVFLRLCCAIVHRYSHLRKFFKHPVFLALKL